MTFIGDTIRYDTIGEFNVDSKAVIATETSSSAMSENRQRLLNGLMSLTVNSSLSIYDMPSIS